MLTVVASGPRPRIAVADAELSAHEARLAQLRKKAGRAVWDLAVEEESAEAVPA